MIASASRSAYLGIDLGTSGLKLTLVGSEGTVIGEAEASYGVHTPRPGHAETDPAEWAGALDEATSVLFGSLPEGGEPSRVASIGVTGQMHGVVLVGDDGKPVRPAVLWPDQRAVPSLSAWRALPAAARERLGNPLVAGMAGPILSWLGEHEPRSLAATEVVMSPKDWLRAVLTSDRTTERSDASATLLWDVVADTWSKEALQLAGVSVEQLPRVVSSDGVVGTTPITVPGRSGEEAVPVVAGGADTACALAAVRVAAAGVAGPEAADILVVNVGTGIQVLRPAVTALASASPVTHLYADTEGGWYEMLAIQNGGFALSWVQAQLAAGWDELVALATSAPPGSSGAVFVPFLTGERGGVASTSSTASWRGLTPTVGRAELARAAFEGLAFTIRRGIDVLGAQPGSPMVLCGGGSREPWLRQLIADVVGLPMRHVQLRSASAMGAAVLAARAVGGQLTVPATVTDLVPAPDEALASAYERWLGAIR
ncbi:MAG TPA: FGGY family carbohydrate kinase [Jiangellaceae bacterium]|nr:FGGY family carbohydrate kinase [Jiangellaceae bacterium]